MNIGNHAIAQSSQTADAGIKQIDCYQSHIQKRSVLQCRRASGRSVKDQKSNHSRAAWPLQWAAKAAQWSVSPLTRAGPWSPHE